VPTGQVRRWRCGQPGPEVLISRLIVPALAGSGRL